MADNPYLALADSKKLPPITQTNRRLPVIPDYGMVGPYQQIEEWLKGAGTPFPNAQQDPGWAQLGERPANFAAGSAAGAGMILNEIAGGAHNFLSDMGTWLQHGNPVAPLGPEQVPGVNEASPNTVTPNTQNSLDAFLKTLGLDKTTTVPGVGGMPAFRGGSTAVARPDYTQMDKYLEAGRPKPSPQGPTDREAGWQGVSDASTQIGNQESPAAALGKLIAGYNTGETNNRQMQMQRDMLDEQRKEEYNLKLAGVEGSRASDEAKYRNLQTQQENEMVQARMNYDMQIWQTGQAHVQMLGDGSIAVTQMDPNTGQTTIKRIGQEDALRSEMMMTQLKAAYGAKGVNAGILQAQQTFGPVLGTVVGAFNQMRTTPGLLESVIPAEANTAIEEEVQRFAAQAGGMGLVGKELGDAIEAKRRELQFQMILGNQQARNNFMGWITPGQQNSFATIGPH